MRHFFLVSRVISPLLKMYIPTSISVVIVSWVPGGEKKKTQGQSRMNCQELRVGKRLRVFNFLVSCVHSSLRHVYS